MNLRGRIYSLACTSSSQEPHEFGRITHVKISQLVNKMCSQQACSMLVNKSEQCCYFIKLLQGCHSQLVDKLLEQLVTSLLSSKTL
jgi:hypothetical protein